MAAAAYGRSGAVGLGAALAGLAEAFERRQRDAGQATTDAPVGMPPIVPPQPQGCSRCDGRGFTIEARSGVASGVACQCLDECRLCRKGVIESRDDRGYYFCSDCWCTRARKRARALTKVGLPARHMAARFEHFDHSARPEVRAAALATRTLAFSFRAGRRGALYFGPVGTGKSYLLTALMRHLAEVGVRCRFVEFSALLADLKSAFDQGNGAASAIVEALVRVPVLALDEIGKGRGSEWELSVVDEIISRRYDAELTTFGTTNYWCGRPGDPAPLGAYSLIDRVGHRIASRLAEMCEGYYMPGDDRRWGRDR